MKRLLGPSLVVAALPFLLAGCSGLPDASDLYGVWAEVDADTATLRRYLVDEAMLDRADGEYWRIGGTFPVED